LYGGSELNVSPLIGFVHEDLEAVDSFVDALIAMELVLEQLLQYKDLKLLLQCAEARLKGMAQVLNAREIAQSLMSDADAEMLWVQLSHQLLRLASQAKGRLRAELVHRNICGECPEAKIPEERPQGILVVALWAPTRGDLPRG